MIMTMTIIIITVGTEDEEVSLATCLILIRWDTDSLLATTTIIRADQKDEEMWVSVGSNQQNKMK
jgi:hypothetical protein